MLSSAHILMCPPDHFGVEYEINPWMHRNRSPDRDRAARQWRGLRRRLEELGARISCLTPVPGLPDLVFTANTALVYEDRAVVAHFRHPERQREESLGQQWFSEHGFQVHALASEAFFEGAGDALFLGDTLFAGYRIRSEIRGYLEIGELLHCRVIPLELIDARYYHLDTCFCPVDASTAVYYPRAFDRYGRRVLHELIETLVPVRDAEAEHFACNAVVVGRTVITNTGCPDLHRQLRARGFATCETPLSEFVLAGGSAKCLNLRLDGEDAAAWKSPEPCLLGPRAC
jgi:N-dimethylarginine dimethylaminohydrolase